MAQLSPFEAALAKLTWQSLEREGAPSLRSVLSTYDAMRRTVRLAFEGCRVCPARSATPPPAREAHARATRTRGARGAASECASAGSCAKRGFAAWED